MKVKKTFKSNNKTQRVKKTPIHKETTDEINKIPLETTSKESSSSSSGQIIDDDTPISKENLSEISSEISYELVDTSIFGLLKNERELALKNLLIGTVRINDLDKMVKFVSDYISNLILPHEIKLFNIIASSPSYLLKVSDLLVSHVKAEEGTPDIPGTIYIPYESLANKPFLYDTQRREYNKIMNGYYPKEMEGSFHIFIPSNLTVYRDPKNVKIPDGVPASITRNLYIRHAHESDELIIFGIETNEHNLNISSKLIYRNTYLSERKTSKKLVPTQIIVPKISDKIYDISSLTLAITKLESKRNNTLEYFDLWKYKVLSSLFKKSKLSTFHSKVNVSDMSLYENIKEQFSNIDRGMLYAIRQTKETIPTQKKGHKKLRSNKLHGNKLHEGTSTAMTISGESNTVINSKLWANDMEKYLTNRYDSFVQQRIYKNWKYDQITKINKILWGIEMIFGKVMRNTIEKKFLFERKDILTTYLNDTDKKEVISLIETTRTNEELFKSFGRYLFPDPKLISRIPTEYDTTGVFLYENVKLPLFYARNLNRMGKCILCTKEIPLVISSGKIPVYYTDMICEICKGELKRNDEINQSVGNYVSVEMNTFSHFDAYSMVKISARPLDKEILNTIGGIVSSLGLSEFNSDDGIYNVFSKTANFIYKELTDMYTKSKSRRSREHKTLYESIIIYSSIVGYLMIYEQRKERKTKQGGPGGPGTGTRTKLAQSIPDEILEKFGNYFQIINPNKSKEAISVGINIQKYIDVFYKKILSELHQGKYNVELEKVRPVKSETEMELEMGNGLVELKKNTDKNISTLLKKLFEKTSEVELDMMVREIGRDVRDARWDNSQELRDETLRKLLCTSVIVRMEGTKGTKGTEGTEGTTEMRTRDIIDYENIVLHKLYEQVNLQYQKVKYINVYTISEFIDFYKQSVFKKFETSIYTPEESLKLYKEHFGSIEKIIEHYSKRCFDESTHEFYFGICINCGLESELVNGPNVYHNKQVSKKYLTDAKILYMKNVMPKLIDEFLKPIETTVSDEEKYFAVLDSTVVERLSMIRNEILAVFDTLRKKKHKETTKEKLNGGKKHGLSSKQKLSSKVKDEIKNYSSSQNVPIITKTYEMFHGRKIKITENLFKFDKEKLHVFITKYIDENVKSKKLSKEMQILLMNQKNFEFNLNKIGFPINTLTELEQKMSGMVNMSHADKQKILHDSKIFLYNTQIYNLKKYINYILMGIHIVKGPESSIFSESISLYFTYIKKHIQPENVYKINIPESLIDIIQIISDLGDISPKSRVNALKNIFFDIIFSIPNIRFVNSTFKYIIKDMNISDLTNSELEKNKMRDSYNAFNRKMRFYKMSKEEKIAEGFLFMNIQEQESFFEQQGETDKAAHLTAKQLLKEEEELEVKRDVVSTDEEENNDAEYYERNEDSDKEEDNDSLQIESS